MGASVKVGETYTVGVLIDGQAATTLFDETKALVKGITPARVPCIRGPVGWGTLTPHIDDDDKMTATLDFGDVIANCIISKTVKGTMILTVVSL